MQCYTELIPPSAVTHAVSLPFLGPHANNLVVAKTSLLQIFAAKHVIRATADGGNDGSSKLALVGEYSLAGTVTALQPVKISTSRTGGAALLVAFKDAKLSLIEWDPENYRINTISIHYYEGENIITQPFGPSIAESESFLTVDPSSRCAALKFGQRHLAILPFRQAGDEVAEEVENGLDTDMAEPQGSALKRTTTNAEAEEETKPTPYKPSFVLPLTMLDPALTHPVDLAFLHEYREPTFGVLSSSQEPSCALLEERRDCLTYTVFTLDLEQRASTNLISVSKLPTDLWRVIPLALPVGGALLVGTNEIVHIDQSGKTSAVAVNEYARQASNLNMADQSDLGMKLEGCELEVIDPTTGDMLLVQGNGNLAILTFKLVGRNIAGMTVVPVTHEQGGYQNALAPSSVAVVSSRSVFIGSEDGDSVLLGWAKDTSGLTRKRSHAQMVGAENAVDDVEGAEDMDEDDLYAPTNEVVKRTTSVTSQTAGDDAASYHFHIQDELQSLAPINKTCLGRKPSPANDKLELLAGVGRGNASRAAFLSREIILQQHRSTHFSNAKAAFTACVRSKEVAASATEARDNILFIFDGTETKVYDLAEMSAIGESEEASDEFYTERRETEFESEGETIAIGTLGNGTRLVQGRRTELRTYDHELGLSQIIPMVDEETDAELEVVAVSFSDPYVLVLRDDSSLQVLKIEKSGDVEPLDDSEASKASKWLSGCLYAGDLTGGQCCAFLLTEEGRLSVLALPTLQLVYATPTLPFLPPVLWPNMAQRRGGKEALTELLVTDLGTSDVKRPYLIARTSLDDLAMYEPFWYTGDNSDPRNSGFEGLRWRKVPNTYVPKYDENLDTEAADACPGLLKSAEIGGRHCVYVPGSSPSLLVKESTSLPRVLGLRSSAVKSFTSVNRAGFLDGFALVEGDGSFVEYNLPSGAAFGSGWHVQKLALGEPAEEVRHLAYHGGRGVYVVATCRLADFYLVDQEGHVETDGATLRPQIPQYTLHLLSAKSRQVIQSFPMPYTELITSLKVMQLEVSEHTHVQKPMVVVGTATQRGEDMPAKGAVTVFDIIDVVPDPDLPESGIKLEVAAREDTKGHVTALEPFPGGLIGTAQGLKIMIRGLKEDGSCLPVAFMDGLCQFTELKSLGRSGLWLAGDAWKGLWFGGFVEEPYRLSHLAKTRTHMEVIAADFLPFDGQLSIVIVDAEMDLHVMQFDPENPKSLGGQRLLHRSTFHLGHFASGMSLLPSTLAPFAEQPLTNGHAEDTTPDAQAPSLQHVLTTFQSGAVGLITPVDEATYRRLSALHAHLSSILEHAAGLNPRAYRAVESEGFGARGIVDGSLVQRISELGAVRRAEVLGRAGADTWSLRSDLEILGGGGLSYL
ncbi:protein CFT1 [Hortaea werneckii]|nr:protein CFT1 [Hortaea werneckii]